MHACTHSTLGCCRVHHDLHDMNSTHVYLFCTLTTHVHSGLHPCMCFSTCFFGMHAIYSLAYTRVIYSNPNMCMGTYYEKLNVTFMGLEILLTALTFMNKYTMNYGYTHITTLCILTLWFNLDYYLKYLETKFC